MKKFQDFVKMKENQESLSKHKAVEIMYIAAMLTKDSQKALYESIAKRISIPDNWKKYCHHMTIRFKPTKDSELPVFGESVTLVVTEIASDEKGVAVRVEPNTVGKELNMPPEQLPHITVATAPGVSPVYSNDLLRKGIGFKMPQALLLNAYIGAKMKSGPIMPERHDSAVESF